MSHKGRVTGRRRFLAGYLAIGIAAVAGVGPASFAQERALDRGRSAVTGSEAQERQTLQRPASRTGVSLDVPIGSASVGAGSLDGELIHVRRTKAKEGMAIVEVSTTPFMTDEETRAGGGAVVRPDQPASW